MGGVVKGLRILIVEDDLVLGMLLADTLIGLGHSICAIERTEAGAIAAAAQYRPEMIIVDAALDHGSGVSAMRAILRTGPVAHVFTSGTSLKIPDPNAVLLRKPFREGELVHALQRALDAVDAQPAAS